MADSTNNESVASQVRQSRQYDYLAQLLENEPLHSQCEIQMLFQQPQFGYIARPKEIRIHCAHEECSGTRRHIHPDGLYSHLKYNNDVHYWFIVFVCTNCNKSGVTFGLKVVRKSEHASSGVCTKIYQEPPHGHPIPKRLFHVIGESNREYFLQARRSIARGLGIGAYAYYRRIVENKKFDLVSSVLEIAEATSAPAGQIAALEKAQSETQFSKAIDMLRDVSAIPPVLLIDGHNPLLLIHDLLSSGLHQLTDEECLERAQETEVILCEIAERMQIALTDQRNVKAAISSIMKRKSGRSSDEKQEM